MVRLEAVSQGGPRITIAKCGPPRLPDTERCPILHPAAGRKQHDEDPSFDTFPGASSDSHGTPRDRDGRTRRERETQRSWQESLLGRVVAEGKPSENGPSASRAPSGTAEVTPSERQKGLVARHVVCYSNT